MRADKVREIDSNDLKHQLPRAEEQMFRLRFQMAMGQTDGLKKYRSLRQRSRADAHASCASARLPRRSKQGK